MTLLPPGVKVHLALGYIDMREGRRINIEQETCTCCGGPLHFIGESVSEMLDHVPARLRVIRIRRPRFGCRACGTIHPAPAAERPIAKGLATPGLLAHVLVSKYCDHLPLYRYGCRTCGTIRQTPAPERPIAKCLASPGFWLKSSSQSTAITFRCIGRAKSSPARRRAGSLDPPPIGLAARSGS